MLLYRPLLFSLRLTDAERDGASPPRPGLVTGFDEDDGARISSSSPSLPLLHPCSLLRPPRTCTPSSAPPQPAHPLFSPLLFADPERRISIAALKELSWFKKESLASFSPPLPVAPPPTLPPEGEQEEDGDDGAKSPRFYNAFELITAMGGGLDLSGLFEMGGRRRGGRRRGGRLFTSRKTTAEVVERLERVGKGLGFGVERWGKGGWRLRMDGRKEGRKGRLVVAAKVFEAVPGMAIVELSKASGDTIEYNKFCREDVRPSLKDIIWSWQGDENIDAAGAPRTPSAALRVMVPGVEVIISGCCTFVGN